METFIINGGGSAIALIRAVLFDVFCSLYIIPASSESKLLLRNTRQFTTPCCHSMATLLPVATVSITGLIVIASILGIRALSSRFQVLPRLWLRLSAVLYLINVTVCCLVSIHLFVNSHPIMICAFFLWHSGKVLLYFNESLRLLLIFDGVISSMLKKFCRFVLAPLLCFPLTSLVEYRWVSVSRWLFIGCCICYMVLLSLCSFIFCHRIRRLVWVIFLSINLEVEDPCSHAICIMIRSNDSKTEEENNATAKAMKQRADARAFMGILMKQSTLDLWIMVSLLVVTVLMTLSIFDIVSMDTVLVFLTADCLINVVCSPLRFSSNDRAFRVICGRVNCLCYILWRRMLPPIPEETEEEKFLRKQQERGFITKVSETVELSVNGFIHNLETTLDHRPSKDIIGIIQNYCVECRPPPPEEDTFAFVL